MGIALNAGMIGAVYSQGLSVGYVEGSFKAYGNGCDLKSSDTVEVEYDAETSKKGRAFIKFRTKREAPHIEANYKEEVPKKADSVLVRTCYLRFAIEDKSGEGRMFSIRPHPFMATYYWELEKNNFHLYDGLLSFFLHPVGEPGVYYVRNIKDPGDVNEKKDFEVIPIGKFEPICAARHDLVFKIAVNILALPNQENYTTSIFMVPYVPSLRIGAEFIPECMSK